MASSALIDKSRSPTAADVRQVLGETHQLWDRIVSVVTTRHFPIENVWSHGGAKYGWTLRLKRKDRVLVYLTPQNAFLLAGFALGERAVAAALEAGVPEAVRALIEAARKKALADAGQ